MERSSGYNVEVIHNIIHISIKVSVDIFIVCHRYVYMVEVYDTTIVIYPFLSVVIYISL